MEDLTGVLMGVCERLIMVRESCRRGVLSGCIGGRLAPAIPAAVEVDAVVPEVTKPPGWVLYPAPAGSTSEEIDPRADGCAGGRW